MTEQPPVDLAGRTVRVREFTEADIDDAYIGWLNDPVVTRFSNQRFRTHNRATSKGYLDSFAGSPNHFLSVRRLSDDSAIGTMTAYFQPHHGTVDVGILIGDRSCWGQGQGQDAWDVVQAWLLGRPDVRKMTAGTLVCNVGMVRLMERSGMQLEGVRRAQEILENEPQDIVLYARFRQ